MQHRFTMEAVDRTCRDLLDVDRPFGGITVVFGGDYQQILPVVPKASRQEIVNSSLQRSYLWRAIELLYLKKNMRLRQTTEEQAFADWLLDIGHGRRLADNAKTELPVSLICQGEDELIRFIYPGINSTPPPPSEYFLERTILAPRNSDVADINLKILNQMSGAARTYLSADSIEHERGADGPNVEEEALPIEFLRSLDASGLPPGTVLLSGSSLGLLMIFR
jgi:hypothetical protein